MRSLPAKVKEHRHFVVVATLLTLVMTFPTIVYVFRTDIFSLPTGKSSDVYVKLWDIWYGGQVFTGKASRFHTDLIYYPEGVSLATHSIFPLHGLVVNALQTLMPLSNAYSLTFLLIILSSVAAAYAYICWLFKDKWIALFGAVIFGFSPLVLGHPNWPAIAWIAPAPMVAYFVHRGICESNSRFVILGGVLAGLICEVSLYFYVIVLISLGLALGALTVSRWRDDAFWRQTALLILGVALSSGWRVIPILQDTSALETVLGYYGQKEVLNDLVSFVVNPDNPFLCPIAKSVFDWPDCAWNIDRSYLGFLPLGLIAFGFVSRQPKRKMAAWLGLGLVFVFLHLGSTLTINGIEFENVKLPKHYLNQLLPTIFEWFYRTNHFMAGICLPLAVLACYGLAALKERFPGSARPIFILGLIVIVAFEYYIPVKIATVDPVTLQPFTEERLAFVDWLKQDETQDKRLINLPFGRNNAKLYLFYQTLTGYPQTEGGISRTPDYAYDYIRANPALNAWYERQPTNCAITGRGAYLSSLTQLANDGFSHVVHHRGFHYWDAILESFRYVDAAYSDDYVSIYRLTDLLESCPA